MPVIVVGADTEPGAAIVDRLYDPEREIRVFVSDERHGLELKDRGIKVAIGDVSDESHVEAASLRCFSAVLIAEAATDTRERSFADTRQSVLQGWAQAVSNSRVRRVIWVLAGEPPETKVNEVATVDPGDPDLATRVFELDEASSLE
ncbi:MAG: NAD-binding protein [Acidimicrobiia bacterium]|jgi:hypothetical protein